MARKANDLRKKLTRYVFARRGTETKPFPPAPGAYSVGLHHAHRAMQQLVGGFLLLIGQHAEERLRGGF